uniref:DNA-directed RNA polymerase n=1 Tax=Lotharella vacuolata TaxID=74820 RepID=A0A0H5BHG8_9EUKA|nr:largest subunit of RNA polymerase I [Lotharella vacuolata]
MLVTFMLKSLFYIIPEKFYEILPIFIEFYKYFSIVKKSNIIYTKRFCELPFYILNFWHASLVEFLSNLICLNCFKGLVLDKYFNSSIIISKALIFFKKIQKHGKKFLNYAINIKNKKKFFQNINFNNIFTIKNKKIDKYNFCNNCKKNIPLQNLDNKFFISYIKITKKMNDKAIVLNDLNADLKNLLKRVWIIILNFTEIKENMRKLWHNDSFFLEYFFKNLFILREFYKTYWVPFIDFNNFFVKSINGKNFFDNFYNKKRVISKTITRYHFNLIKTKISNIRKNIEYKVRLKESDIMKNSINLDYKNLIQRFQQKIYIFKKNNRIQSLNKILEKKKGLVRNNILGKRVNYSSRTVVVPDPFIKGGCIGFSEILAKKIHLIDYFLPWNIVYFKKRNKDFMFIFKKKFFESYIINKITRKNLLIFLKMLKKTFEFNIFTPLKKNSNKIIIYGKPFLRTIYDNDHMIANRQPTLHRLGIMGHKSKILPSCLVFSINYVNCKSYNADFDGDEINVHIMQSIHSKVEIINLLSSDLHTVVPKDGSVIRYLIQDCLVSLTYLLKKDTFIEEEELKEIIKDYQIYNTFLCFMPTIHINYCKKKIWTGKQIFSSVLQYFTGKCCKISHFYIKNNDFSDADFKIINYEEEITFLYEENLLIGNINKEDFKNEGMFLKIHEYLGNIKFTRFLRKLDKICFSYISVHGLTLGPNELQLCRKYNFRMNYNILCFEKLFKRITGRICEFLSFCSFSFKVTTICKYETYFKDYIDDYVVGFKDFFRKKISEFNIINRFHKKDSCNSFVQIIDSGSKGSYRNMELICFNMGKINTEKENENLYYFFCKTTGSLFYFASYFSGLDFLELYLHSISGRIGILESSLTVFRSGYLQRSIIKNIENIYIAEDFTFRDISNNEILAFSSGVENVNYNHIFYKRYYNFSNNYFLKKIIKFFKTLSYKNINPFTFIFRNISKQQHILFTNLYYNYVNFFSKNIFMKKSNFNKCNIQILINILEFLNTKKVFNNSKHFNSVIFLNHIYSIRQLIYQITNLHKVFHFNDLFGILCGQSLCQPLTQMTLDSFHNIGLLEHSEIDGISKLCYIIQEISNTKKKSIIAFSVNNKTTERNALINFTFNSINYLTGSNIINNVFVIKIRTSKMKQIFCYNINIIKVRLLCNTLKINLKIICIKLKNLIYLDFLKFIIYKFNLKKLSAFEKLNITHKKKFKKILNYDKFSKWLHNIDRNVFYSIYTSNLYISFGAERLKHYIRYIYKVLKKNFKIIYQYLKKNSNKYSVIDYKKNTIQLSLLSISINFSSPYDFFFLKSTNKLNIQHLKKMNHIKTNYLLGGAFGNIIAQGINLRAILKYKKFLKLNSIYLGGHSTFMYFFGVEATYNKIYKEIASILKIMKVRINHIFLKMIANFMTFKGFVVKLNRYGMKFSGSVIHKIGYENIYNYFREGIEHFFIEKADTHTSSLLLGEKIRNGTGDNRRFL